MKCFEGMDCSKWLVIRFDLLAVKWLFERLNDEDCV